MSTPTNNERGAKKGRWSEETRQKIMLAKAKRKIIEKICDITIDEALRFPEEMITLNPDKLAEYLYYLSIK